MAVTQAKIANGAALSGEIDLRHQKLIAIQFPAAWTAADLSFQAAVESSGTFGEAFIDPGTGVGAALLLDAAASQVSFFNQANMLRNCFIKIRSGPVGAPVNQGAERILTLITEPI